MKVKTQDIQKLRETTGAGVIDCQKALKDANGDLDAAVSFIRERGLLKVAKRSGRNTAAGIVHSYVHNGRIGVILELRAETDFVVRSEPFRNLTHELAMQVAASDPADVDALLDQPYIKDAARTVKDVVNEVIAKVGENVEVNKFYRIEI